MKNPKTTIIGAVLAAIIAVEPLITIGSVDWTRIAIGALIAGLSFYTKDK